MASQPQSQTSSGRRASRRPFDASVQFRAGTRRAQVQVRNISQLGARIAGVFLVRQDEHFWIKLPNLEPVEARVVWVEDFEFGCEFARPLNEVVLERILSSC
jgi:PilZ domain